MQLVRPFPLFLCAFIALCAPNLRADDKILTEEVRKIAGMLPSMPASFGQPITNREAWQKYASNPALQSIISKAEDLAQQPIPEMTDDLYLDFSKTGNRDRGQKVLFALSARVTILTLAECVENKGRFIEPLQKTIEAICSQRSWTYPAHDSSLDAFHGKTMHPDLRATTLAFDLGTADYLLGDKLPAATRQLLRDNVRRHVLLPFRGTVEGHSKEAYWLRMTHNWNAVCLAGTLGAALAVEPSQEDRAFYVAAAEKYIEFFLSGFGKDGYCYEGMGYWNYGFGHFIMLTEEIRQATRGQIDLFQKPEVELPAQFGIRDEIINGVYPSISDVNPGIRPASSMMRYVGERFGLARKTGTKYSDGVSLVNLAEAAFALAAEEPWPIAKKISTTTPSSLRTWFYDGGVLIERPGANASVPFAAVLKGGSNGESHNHNDVGSFSVVLGRSMLVCDPGGEVYTRRTFGPHRYDSGVLNSFGHAVPVVAGQLQSTGSAAHAVVIRTNFTDQQDELVFDIRSAYQVADLKKLERTFVYRRGSEPSLSIHDNVAFEKPEQFESALITWGDWQAISKNEFMLSDEHHAVVRVNINTGGVPFTVRKTQIDEQVHTPNKPWHIGIVLDRPVSNAVVTIRITPAKGR